VKGLHWESEAIFHSKTVLLQLFVAQFTIAISREFSDYEVRLYTTTGREIPSTVWRNEQSLTIQPRVFERGLLIAMMYIDGVLYAKNVVAQ